MKNAAQDATNSAKSLARQIAKQISEEPLEVLKTAGSHVTGGEKSGQPETEKAGQNREQNNLAEAPREQLENLKSARRIEALNREISDIKRQKLFNDLQRRISNGEEVPLEDFQELSMEQKQVLKAQMEAVKLQRQNMKTQPSALVEPATKRGRQLFNFGKKTEVKRQQTHVEKNVPPSG